jgi:hypothetical protein
MRPVVAAKLRLKLPSNKAAIQADLRYQGRGRLAAAP